MTELSVIDIIKNALGALIDSKVFILFILEFAILLISLVFSKAMDKKIVKRTSIGTSIIVLLFYITNYVGTLITFINNVTTKFMELLYFPTTLEFMVIMVTSFVIMAYTLMNKKASKIIKVINTSLPISISFLFLTIIEFINKYNIDFDEFSVFTNPILMSLYELAMGLSISWFFGLIIYKIDKMIIKHMNEEKIEMPSLNTLVTVDLSSFDDEIEMPKLKSQI